MCSGGSPLSWDLAWMLGFPVVEPVNADFADLNSPTVSTTGGGILMTTTGPGASHVIRARIKAAPSTPYTITVAAIPMNRDEQWHGYGFCVSDDTKVLTLGVNQAAGPQVLSEDWTNVTTYGAANFTAFRIAEAPVLFLRYSDNGTNRILSWSTDGINFLQLLSEGRTTFLTATKIGMFVHAYGSNPTNAHFIHWRQS